MKKKEGKIEVFISCIALIMVVLIVIMSVKLKEIKLTKNYIDDGLVSSLLASATIDLKEYGSSNNIINNDPEQSYYLFKDTLKSNLNLNNDFSAKNSNLITDKVNIEKFVIYNVKTSNDIEIIEVENGKIVNKTKENSGVLTTPEGVKIEKTTFYAKISFYVSGYLNNEKYKIVKEKSVDVTDIKES